MAVLPTALLAASDRLIDLTADGRDVSGMEKSADEPTLRLSPIKARALCSTLRHAQLLRATTHGADRQQSLK